MREKGVLSQALHVLDCGPLGPPSPYILEDIGLWTWSKVGQVVKLHDKCQVWYQIDCIVQRSGFYGKDMFY